MTVASYTAEFIHHDAVANLNVSDPTNFHIYPEVKRKLYSALAEGDEGELAIAIPPHVSVKQVCSVHFPGTVFIDILHTNSQVMRPLVLSQVKVRDSCITSPLLYPERRPAATPEPATPGPRLSTPMLPEFSPITVTIEYTLRQPTDGIQFVLPTEAYPHVRAPRADLLFRINIMSCSVFLMYIQLLQVLMQHAAGCLV